MHLEPAERATAELQSALRRLLPQLTARMVNITAENVEALVGSESSVLVVAREPDASGPIIGIGTLGIYRVPTGIRAVIEDVVVDESARGHGIGAALILRLLDLARQRGAATVTLTSNPRRKEANQLYARLGFALRSTNCYYYNLAPV
jgi:GNAT superfamily N-acetyltransferase